jgi:hypothetical protein
MADRQFEYHEIYPDADETEHLGKTGPTQIPVRKRAGAGAGNFKPGEQSLTAIEKARLDRLVGRRDPRLPINRRIQTGESEKRTAAQIEGDRRNGTGNTGP